MCTKHPWTAVKSVNKTTVQHQKSTAMDLLLRHVAFWFPFFTCELRQQHQRHVSMVICYQPTFCLTKKDIPNLVILNNLELVGKDNLE